MDYRLKIGTRGSNLALIQKDIIVDLMRNHNSNIDFETIIINTTGDQIRNVPISQIGTTGVFSEELTRALTCKELDLVVHSLKDLPTKISQNTVIGCITERESPYDVAVFSNNYKSLSEIPLNGIIGTSSPRRIAQIKKLYPDLKVADIRGNIGTRINKLTCDNKYDAIVLAHAGLNRCKFTNLHLQSLSGSFLYAVGQGALGVQCNRDDRRTIEACAKLTDITTALCCICEREILKTLEGGCCVPIGVVTNIENNKLSAKCGIFSLDGRDSIVEQMSIELPTFNVINMPPFDIISDVVISCASLDAAKCCVEVGQTLAQRIINQGGKKILDNISHVCLTRPIEQIISYDK